MGGYAGMEVARPAIRLYRLRNSATVELRRLFGRAAFRRVVQFDGRVAYWEHRSARTGGQWRHGLPKGLNGFDLEPDVGQGEPDRKALAGK